MCDLTSASARIGLRLSKDNHRKDVLSPLMLKIFFAGVIVVFHRFSENTGILVDLVHLKELSTTSMGPESVMEYVHRAV